VFINAHQVHGAIGFSTEYDLQLFTRRAKAFEVNLGATAFHTSGSPKQSVCKESGTRSEAGHAYVLNGHIPSNTQLRRMYRTSSERSPIRNISYKCLDCLSVSVAPLRLL
jgi:hypothetical protein